MRCADVSRLVLLAWWVSGCTPEVNIGADVETMTTGCELGPPLRTCPAGQGAPVAFSSPADVQQRLRGRWVFCGGERRTTGRGALGAFYGGVGLDLWEEEGRLNYAFLVGPLEQLARRVEVWAQGTVEVGVGELVLVAGDGVETRWAVDLFSDQPVLRARGFDSWTFVQEP
ncbi:MAG: hypothetical protein ACOZQL_02910 [Myxococcota bacterium]